MKELITNVLNKVETMEFTTEEREFLTNLLSDAKNKEVKKLKAQREKAESNKEIIKVINELLDKNTKIFARQVSDATGESPQKVTYVMNNLMKLNKTLDPIARVNAYTRIK